MHRPAVEPPPHARVHRRTPPRPGTVQPNVGSVELTVFSDNQPGSDGSLFPGATLGQDNYIPGKTY